MPEGSDIVAPISISFICGLMRTGFLVSTLLACASVVAAQAAPSDADGFVTSIYDKGHEANVWAEWLDGSRRQEWFSMGLTALWTKCDAIAHHTGDVLGPVDFDVATNSQGMDVMSFTVKTLSRDSAHAHVLVKLTPNNWVRKSQRENEIRYELVLEHGRWKIDDIHSVIEPKLWSLRGILTRYLGH